MEVRLNEFEEKKMNEIKNHSTSPKHFVVFNASDSVIAEAKQLIKSNLNNAKITPNGIIFHINFKSNIETIIWREARDATVAPEFSDFFEMEKWIYDNIGGKASRELIKLTTKMWNKQCAGLTVAQIIKKAI